MVDTSQTDNLWDPGVRMYDVSKFPSHRALPNAIRHEIATLPPVRGTVRSDYMFTVEEVELDADDNVAPSLSKKRVLTHLSATSLNDNGKSKRRTDIMVIFVPGFGESSAHFDSGDLPQIVLSELLRQGYRKPHIAFLNPLGACTKEFMQNKDNLAKIGLKDDIKDIEAMADYLLKTYQPNCDIVVMSHSLGALRQLGVIRAVNKYNGVVNGITSVRAALRQLVIINGARGGLLDFVRPPAVGKAAPYVPKTLRQAITRHGCIEFSPAEHRRLMFDESVSEEIVRWYSERAVAGSLRTFLDLAVPIIQPSMHDVICKAPAARVDIIESENDGLLPPPNTRAEARQFKRGFITDVRTHRINTPHSLPHKMDPGQYECVARVMNAVFKRETA